MKSTNKRVMVSSRTNLKGLFCYAFGWISGIFFLITHWNNRFIRFHAIQSTIFFGIITLFGFLANLFPDFGWIELFLGVLSLLMWKWLMFTAYKGETYKLLFIGRLAKHLSYSPIMDARNTISDYQKQI
jgi:uncharacterized membrane protein